MFSLFSKSPHNGAIPDALYGTVMARSRNPVFFARYGIEDTVMGRFDILSLHVYLFARRMKQEGGEVALALGQDIFDRFVSDVDRALRELGIGDTSVPKKKKRMIRSFYGQIEDFDGPLDAGNMEELTIRALKRFYGIKGQSDAGREISAYMLEIGKRLGEIDFTTITKGEFSWPETADIKNS